MELNGPEEVETLMGENNDRLIAVFIYQQVEATLEINGPLEEETLMGKDMIDVWSVVFIYHQEEATLEDDRRAPPPDDSCHRWVGANLRPHSQEKVALK